MSAKTLRKIILFFILFFAIGALLHYLGKGFSWSAEEVPLENNSQYTGEPNQNEPEPQEPITINNNIEDSKSMHIYYLDTGNSDCVLVVFPDGKSVLMDTGDVLDAEPIISFIKEKGVNSLDALVLTHWHADHAYNTDKILEALPTSVVYAPIIPDEFVPTTSWYQKTLRYLINSNTSVVSPNVGDEIVSGQNYSLFFLNSSNEDSSWQLNDQNKYSLMTMLRFGKHQYIFTGDADKENEDLVLKQWKNENLDVEVLKAGHHCSKTASSEKWIKATSPEYAICLVGKNNSYGHPHKSVLSLFNKYGIVVYRSDKDKTIEVIDDGNVFKINTGLSSANGEQ